MVSNVRKCATYTFNITNFAKPNNLIYSNSENLQNLIKDDCYNKIEYQNILDDSFVISALLYSLSTIVLDYIA